MAERVSAHRENDLDKGASDSKGLTCDRGHSDREVIFRLQRTAGNAAVAIAHCTELWSENRLLALQRFAGNRAVADLLHPGHRVAKDVSKAPEPDETYRRTQDGGTPTDAGFGAGLSGGDAGKPDAGTTPLVGVTEQELTVRQPGPMTGSAGPTSPPGPRRASGDSCAQPMSMNKVTSGAFLGGLTMEDYYPGIVGRGYYDHPGTAGTFDTGSRAGANIQLFGVIPSSCRPSQFRLEQLVTSTRARVNGDAEPSEGSTMEDISMHGQDASRKPFRHDFLGGGTAPLGYVISMADPPSSRYGPELDVESENNFVTSLIGPGGQQSVTWSTAVETKGGRVVRNTLS